MSGGVQYRSWATKPQNKALIDKVKSAHFHHYLGGDDYGLTYQSCRFCGELCFRNEDRDHGEKCLIRERSGDVCCGLWKYNVRHYICSDCRTDILIGLPPVKSRGGRNIAV